MEGKIWQNPELSGVCCFRTRNSESECGKRRRTGASDPNRHLSSPLANARFAGATSSNARGGASRHNRRAPEVRHYLCCRTPRRCPPSGARSRQVALRQADPRCGERALEQKQRHSEGNVSRLLTDRRCDCDRESHNTAKLQCAKSFLKTLLMVLYV